MTCVHLLLDLLLNYWFLFLNSGWVRNWYLLLIITTYNIIFNLSLLFWRVNCKIIRLLWCVIDIDWSDVILQLLVLDMIMLDLVFLMNKFNVVCLWLMSFNHWCFLNCITTQIFYDFRILVFCFWCLHVLILIHSNLRLIF